MVESFGLMSEFSTKTAHPIDVVLSKLHVKGIWIVSFSKRLALLKSLQNLVHWHFCLEFLVRTSDSLDNVACYFVDVISIVTLLDSQDSTCNISEASTLFTISEVLVANIRQIFFFVLSFALYALQLNLHVKSFASRQLCFASQIIELFFSSAFR